MQVFISCAPLVVLRVKGHRLVASQPQHLLVAIPIVQEACATLVGDACHYALYCQPPVTSGSGRGSFSRLRKCPFQTKSGASGDRLRGLAQRQASSASFFMLLPGLQCG